MALFTLHLELAEPYQAAGRALDLARKMGFQLVRLRVDAVPDNKHRMDIGLRAPTNEKYWRDCLFQRLKGTPGINRVTRTVAIRI